MMAVTSSGYFWKLVTFSKEMCRCDAGSWNSSQSGAKNMQLWHHNLYIWNHIQYVGWHIHLTCHIHSQYLCHLTHCIDNITPTLFMISHTPCVALFALYKTSQPHFLTSNHHFEDITPTILDIVSTVSVSSHQLYQWYHSHFMFDITSSICETFCLLYLWHCMHYVWHHNPLCWLHHTRHIYDIICTTEDVKSTLSLQATIFMTSHPLQAWHHTPCIRHCTNCIFVITTSPLISHPLLYDITPTICVTSHALYITSYPLLISSHYFSYDSTNWTYETTSSMQLKIYTILVTSQSVVCVITPTVLRASHPLFVWHHTHLHYRRYYILTLWNQTTIFMTSEPLYLTSYQRYFCQHIHCIDDITPTLFMRSHPLYMLTSYPLYMTSLPLMCVITPTFSTVLHPLYVGHHTHYMYHITYTV